MKVPLIVSGNIFTVKDALDALKITGAMAVMIGRGGIGNPLLIKDLQDALNGKEPEYLYTFESQKRMCIELADSLLKEKGETLAMRIYRSIAPKFFSGFPNSKSLRVKLASTMTTYQSMLDILNDFSIEDM